MDFSQDEFPTPTSQIQGHLYALEAIIEAVFDCLPKEEFARHLKLHAALVRRNSLLDPADESMKWAVNVLADFESTHGLNV